MTTTMIVVITAIIAGALGYSLANAANHIVRFLFFVAIILVLLALLFGKSYYDPLIHSHPTVPPTTQVTPVPHE